MLTADLVRARRKSGELIVVPLSGRFRERAVELADTYLAVARAQVGRTRDELRQAWSGVQQTARERKLCAGLMKLIEDACEFSAESPVDPRDLRRAVFEHAALARRSLTTAFDRAEVLRAVATELAGEHALSPETIEQALYADLRGAHSLLKVEPLSSESLVRHYERAQLQAVLLRAVKVVADVEHRSADGYRYLFRQLKFRRLLHRISALDTGGYRIEIDGPYSLFDSVTKYGLSLALVLPALEACDRLNLAAELRWGKTRDPLLFRLHRSASDDPGAPDRDAVLPPEIAALLDAFKDLGSAWRGAPASDILELPGIGLCVPDLVFERSTGERIFFEALGYWSRDAVWKRVELAQQGLRHRILFAVSERLRVSEAVLDDVDRAALYVYKGAMSARAVERKLEALAAGG